MKVRSASCRLSHEPVSLRDLPYPQNRQVHPPSLQRHPTLSSLSIEAATSRIPPSLLSPGPSGPT